MRATVCGLLMMAMFGYGNRALAVPDKGLDAKRSSQITRTEVAVARCRPGKSACIVKVGEVSLIRTTSFWLLDVRTGKPVDAKALAAAAQSCDSAGGCGVAITQGEAEAMANKLKTARGSVELMAKLAVPVFQHGKGTVYQVSGSAANLASVGVDVQCQCPGAPPVIPRGKHPPIPPKLSDLLTHVAPSRVRVGERRTPGVDSNVFEHITLPGPGGDPWPSLEDAVPKAQLLLDLGHN